MPVANVKSSWSGGKLVFEDKASGTALLTLDGPNAAVTVGASASLTEPFAVASADGAVTLKSGTVYITKGSAAALTIADPTATTDDGKTLTVVATTAHAHTLSNAAGSGFNAGGASVDVGTFGGAKGDCITITAYQGDWYVTNSINVTLA